jgi:hypothetical protein
MGTRSLEWRFRAKGVLVNGVSYAWSHPYVLVPVAVDLNPACCRGAVKKWTEAVG